MLRRPIETALVTGHVESSIGTSLIQVDYFRVNRQMPTIQSGVWRWRSTGAVAGEGEPAPTAKERWRVLSAKNAGDPTTGAERGAMRQIQRQRKEGAAVLRPYK